jgi:hypothetical protein
VLLERGSEINIGSTKAAVGEFQEDVNSRYFYWRILIYNVSVVIQKMEGVL